LVSLGLLLKSFLNQFISDPPSLVYLSAA
jgi:hypothetical protein